MKTNTKEKLKLLIMFSTGKLVFQPILKVCCIA